MTRTSISICAVLIGSAVLAALSVGCERRESVVPAGKDTKKTPAVQVKDAPSSLEGIITLDQELQFADGRVTEQGLGFLARTPSGAIAGVTSAHFLDQEGPRLVRIVWRADGKLVATATRSYGPAGNEGVVTTDRVDLRSDYLALVLDAPPLEQESKIEVLELETGGIPANNEAVWLPYDEPLLDIPRQRLEGKIVESYPFVGVITLVKPHVFLAGHSGSPFINTRGKVIGLLSRAVEVNKETNVLAAPVGRLAIAIKNAEHSKDFRSLQSVVGKGSQVDPAQIPVDRPKAIPTPKDGDTDNDDE